MSRELEQIGQVTAVGDLPEKLQAAEESKMKVEALLLERVSFCDLSLLFQCVSFVENNSSPI